MGVKAPTENLRIHRHLPNFYYDHFGEIHKNLSVPNDLQQALRLESKPHMDPAKKKKMWNTGVFHLSQRFYNLALYCITLFPTSSAGTQYVMDTVSQESAVKVEGRGENRRGEEGEWFSKPCSWEGAVQCGSSVTCCRWEYALAWQKREKK